MSETKFTKGEWVVIDDGTDSIVNTELDLHICSLYSRVDNFTHDAHLIAAAPEMYEMLGNSLNEIYMLVNKVNEKNAGFTDYDDMHMVREIKLLLAKARGEK